MAKISDSMTTIKGTEKEREREREKGIAPLQRRKDVCGRGGKITPSQDNVVMLHCS